MADLCSKKTFGFEKAFFLERDIKYLRVKIYEHLCVIIFGVENYKLCFYL